MASTKRRKNDDEDEDRPRKKKKKPRGPGMLPLYIGGGIAAVALIVALSVGLIFVLRNGGNPNQAKLPQDLGLKADLGQAEAMAFHQKFSNAGGRLAESTTKLQTVIGLPQSFRPQLQDARNALSAVRGDASSWKVPNTNSAKKLNTCFQEYLQLNDTYLQRLDPYLTARENRRPAVPPSTAELLAKANELDRLEQAFLQGSNKQ